MEALDRKKESQVKEREKNSKILFAKLQEPCIYAQLL